jgi:hypothetical protein
MEQTATQGMCLSACSTVGDACPVQDSATQLAACAGQAGTDYICLYFCQLQGQTFSCPNSTDYKCIAIDSTQPTTTVCVPK